jgi:serine phosphatase RsbU (regulator of sigma subunit)/anti-sigma regulatory factor (Ser/Thr protein kinase)/anti-anti-sigma regulatory factor
VTAEDDDALDRQVGDAGVVRGLFDEVPIMLAGMAGPELTIVGMNAAYRAAVGRAEPVGSDVRELFPEVVGQQIFEMLDRVYAGGEPVTAHEWRLQLDRDGNGVPEDVYLDFTVSPRYAPDGAVIGLLAAATDVTERVAERQATQERAARAERRYEAARDVVAELQEALLPTGLPVLPGARIGARYLVAGADQAAGGDWFDAVPLADGRVALIVGDVVGHGVAASAAMGQLRTVLTDRLVSETDLIDVLAHVDTFAARSSATRAATLGVAVLDPTNAELVYSCLGHPPPLVISADGATRYLPGSETGPLGTGQLPTLLTETLGPDEVVLLYSDGLIERPGRSLDEGRAELAQVAADAAANRVLPVGAAPSTAERVCQLTVELLTRTGYADDVTTLAAQRLSAPIAPLDLNLAAELGSVQAARRAFSAWVDALDLAGEDRQGVAMAVGEAVTNAVEHAYPVGQPGTVGLSAAIEPSGLLQVQVSDHGSWHTPETGTVTNRGRGLVMAERLVDELTVTHPPQEAVAPGGARGTTVTVRHRLHRPAMLASNTAAQPAEHPSEPPFAVETDTAVETPRVRVRGPVEITTAEKFTTRLLSAARGGVLPLTVDLSEVTHLASAGVQALHEIQAQLAAHRQALHLVAPGGSPAHLVLDLVRLPHSPGNHGDEVDPNALGG